MKKLFLCASVLFLALCGYADENALTITPDSEISNALYNAVYTDDDPASAFSHKNSMIDITVYVERFDLHQRNIVSLPRHWSEDYYGPRTDEAIDARVNELEKKWKSYLNDSNYVNRDYAHVTCKMVRISSNWLIGLSSCLPKYIRENPSVNTKDAEKIILREFMIGEENVAYALDGNIKIDGNYIDPTENMFINKDLILVYVPAKNITEKIHKLSKANIFIPQKSTDFITSIYIDEKQINEPDFTIEGFTLTATSEDSGTPAFFADNKRQEFLFAFNSTPYESVIRGVGVVARFRSKSGKQYKLFTQDMKDFIQKTIFTKTPDEWPKVNNKIVSENYFKNK